MDNARGCYLLCILTAFMSGVKAFLPKSVRSCRTDSSAWCAVAVTDDKTNKFLAWAETEGDINTPIRIDWTINRCIFFLNQLIFICAIQDCLAESYLIDVVRRNHVIRLIQYSKVHNFHLKKHLRMAPV